MKDRNNYLVGAIRIIVFVLWTIIMPLVFLLGRLLKIEAHKKLVHIFHAGVCRILGIRVHTYGQLSEIKPSLYLSNHISYLDIFVLGRLPAFFIAKSEVATWPVLGTLAKLQNTLFIERKAGRAKDQLKIMQAHLSDNKSLTLFPEGTSTNGTHVKPFKSSLLEAAKLDESSRVAIQPITVAYTHYNGNLIRSQKIRDYYAWYASMPFTSHFFALMPRKTVDAKVFFHPVCYLDEFSSRKECAAHCEGLVAAKLQEFLDPDFRT